MTPEQIETLRRLAVDYKQWCEVHGPDEQHKAEAIEAAVAALEKLPDEGSMWSAIRTAIMDSRDDARAFVEAATYEDSSGYAEVITNRILREIEQRVARDSARRAAAEEAKPKCDVCGDTGNVAVNRPTIRPCPRGCDSPLRHSQFETGWSEALKEAKP